MPKIIKDKPGKLSIKQMRNMINRKAGTNVAFDLNKENPTDVKEWIPTGSRWLDSIISRGTLAGIPVGKISEIAGLESTGKSYMAAQIAANAQKMDIDVVYFDSENALDSTFLERSGCDLDKILYVQASSVEFVLETMESLLESGNKILFIWDSLALTPSKTDIEGDFNPLSSMAVKPRILSKGLSKLLQPIANTKSTLIVLNQLKTNISMNIAEAMTTPWFTPGGKALIYSYSLRIWLTDRKAKASFILDDLGYRIGTEVKARIKKSRFGTQGRQSTFKILWAGEDVRICDEESWFEAIRGSDQLKLSKSWNALSMGNGEEIKFQKNSWLEQLENPKFRKRVLEIMDSEIIRKFDERTGDASNFYDIDSDETPETPPKVPEETLDV